MKGRGYFEIGIFHPKTVHNVGTLWRTAFQMGAAGIFVIGPRFKRQVSDTCDAWRHIPCRTFGTLDEYKACRPFSCRLVGVEMGGVPLNSVIKHPERCQYLLGAEDHGLNEDAKAACDAIISLESVRSLSYNVAVSGAVVMYHRQFIAVTEKANVLRVDKCYE